jgi:predicted esterase
MANPSDVDWSDGVFVINPPSKKTPESTLIWCHGLGDSYEGFSDLMEMISPHLPNTRYSSTYECDSSMCVTAVCVWQQWYGVVW